MCNHGSRANISSDPRAPENTRSCGAQRNRTWCATCTAHIDSTRCILRSFHSPDTAAARAGTSKSDTYSHLSPNRHGLIPHHTAGKNTKGWEQNIAAPTPGLRKTHALVERSGTRIVRRKAPSESSAGRLCQNRPPEGSVRIVRWKIPSEPFVERPVASRRTGPSEVRRRASSGGMANSLPSIRVAPAGLGAGAGVSGGNPNHGMRLHCVRRDCDMQIPV
eukprot:gene3437-biopygen4931